MEQEPPPPPRAIIPKYSEIDYSVVDKCFHFTLSRIVMIT